jgi:hypothetical protein
MASTDYVPLTPPTVPTTTNFNNEAAYLSQWASSLANSGNSYLNALKDVKEIDFSQVGDLPTFSSIVWLGSTSGIGTRPISPTVDLDISDLQRQLAALVVPSPPSGNITYVDPGYSSAMRDAMINKLMNDLINGGYGIDVNDEFALWNRERDREALNAQANIDELKRQAASTSFVMPQGALYTALQKARQEYMNKLSSANRDIGLKRADLYVENRRFILEKVLASEEQSIALYNAVQNRALDIQRLTVQLSIALFEAGIRYYEGLTNALLKQIEAKVTAEEMKVKLYSADVSAYAAYVNALVADAQIQIANSKNILTRDTASYQAKVDITKFRLQQLALTVENMKTINTFGAEFYRTGLAAALSANSGLAVQSTTV